MRSRTRTRGGHSMLECPGGMGGGGGWEGRMNSGVYINSIVAEGLTPTVRLYERPLPG